MWLTILFGFLTGVFFGNGIPHFIKGITKENYPMIFGNKPVPNLIAGWFSFILASVFGYYSLMSNHALAAFISFTIGILLIGLFHAGPGAFGKS